MKREKKPQNACTHRLLVAVVRFYFFFISLRLLQSTDCHFVEVRMFGGM